jgi:hypothetical protein
VRKTFVLLFSRQESVWIFCEKIFFLGVSGFRIVLFFLQIFDVKKLAKKIQKSSKISPIYTKKKKIEKKKIPNFFGLENDKKFVQKNKTLIPKEFGYFILCEDFVFFFFGFFCFLFLGSGIGKLSRVVMRLKP